MGVKDILYGDDVRLRMLRGVRLLARAVGATMGPRGQNVIIDKLGMSPTVTFDGVTVGREISLEDTWEDIGVRLCKEVSGRTNESSGDGTTTATILAHALLEGALREIAAGQEPLHVRRGIEEASEWVLEHLRDSAVPVKSVKDIRSVARVASEDSEMADIVTEALEEVGRDGIITVEDGDGVSTYLDTTTGMEIPQTGYSDTHYINMDDGTCCLEDPVIFCFDGRLESPLVVANLLNACLESERRSALFIADDFGQDVKATLLQNLTRLRADATIKEPFEYCAIRSPLVGRKRKELLEDIAALVGAEVCSHEKGDNPTEWKLEQCGTCRTVVIHKNKVEIVDGSGKEEALQERVNYLRHEITTATSEYDCQKLQERLGRLVGGVTVIRVGAFTETEMRERKRRLEDALSATRAAIEEGIVPGGGVALFRAGLQIPTRTDQVTSYKTFYISGYRVVRSATEACLRALCCSSGIEPGPVICGLQERHSQEGFEAWGFDVLDGQYKDLLQAGILDPHKVLRCAWENAVSFATTVLMTSVAISEADPHAGLEAREI